MKEFVLQLERTSFILVLHGKTNFAEGSKILLQIWK